MKQTTTFSKLFLLLLLLAAASNVACNKSQSAQSEITTITISDKEKISPEQFLDSHRLVRLSQTKIPVGEIEKTIITDKYIILVDNEQANTIFVFNHKGEILSEICRLGRGPQEYTFIQDVALLDYKGQEAIAVADNRQEKLLLYTIDGKYINSIEYPFDFDNIVQSGSKSWLCLTSGDNQKSDAFKERNDGKSLLVFTDLDMKIKSTTMPSPFERVNFVTPDIATNAKDVLITPQFQDTVYRVENCTITPAYRIDLAEFGGVTNTNDWSTDKIIADFDSFVRIHNLYEAKNNIIINAVTKDSFINTYIYNKASGKTYRLEGERTTSFAELNVYDVCATYKDEFAVIIDAVTIEEYNQVFPDQAVMKDIKDSDNPVIMFFTMKKEF